MTQTEQKRKGRHRGPVIQTKYSRWVRLYTGTRNDPKILSLSDRQRWGWLVILMVAGETADGVLPAIPHLAFELRTTKEEAAALVDELILAGLLDIVRRDEAGVVIRPHNWDARQFKSDTSTERSRKHRERQRQPTDATPCNVAATEMQRPDSVLCTLNSDSVVGDIPEPSQEGSDTLSVWQCAEDGVGVVHSAGRSERKYRNNKSGYAGVSRHKKSGRWQAIIGYRGNSYHIGLFDSPDDAHAAYIEVCDDPLSLPAIASDVEFETANNRYALAKNGGEQ